VSQKLFQKYQKGGRGCLLALFKAPQEKLNAFELDYRVGDVRVTKREGQQLQTR
jgi:hypothetical protein